MVALQALLMGPIMMFIGGGLTAINFGHSNWLVALGAVLLVLGLLVTWTGVTLLRAGFGLFEPQYTHSLAKPFCKRCAGSGWPGGDQNQEQCSCVMTES